MARKVTKVVDTTVPTDNYEKQIKQLLEKGKKDKKIDQRDIFAVIPDTPDNIDVLDQLYADLTDASVEVIQATEPIETDFIDEWAVDEEAEEEALPEDTSYIDDIADDSVRLYLREIGKIPLLSAEEELALAQRVVAGDKKAKDQMAEANMRLVVSIAKLSLGPSPTKPVPSVFQCTWLRQSTSFCAPSAA
jgi:RNA polymerase primary sigma factor